MFTLPESDATDDVWHEYAVQSSEILQPYVAEFLVDRFGYARRYVDRSIAPVWGTLLAKTKKYDIYIRLFNKTRDFWPRESLTLARVGFSEQRAGHGRELLGMLLTLAPIFGYQYIAIECANANAAAFSKRMGFTSYVNGYHWIGSISDI